MPRELSEFIQRLKEQYAKNPNIERLFYKDNPLPLASCYLSLALIQEKKIKVSSESVKGKEPETKNDSKESELEDKMRFHFLHEHERILHIQEKIEVTQIPSQCKKTPERIFIEGAAGAGKSTLCRYIAYEWSQNSKAWEKYTWVFYIRLRDLTESRYPQKEFELTDVILDVIEREFFTSGLNKEEKEKEKIKNELDNEKEKVLFVLDGYDELSLNQPKVRAFWDALINSQYSVLLTSRPGTTMVPSNISFETRLAVLGFNDEQVKSYIHKFFDPTHTPNTKLEQGDDYLKALKANLNLWSLAHTPIQLELLCSMWEDTLKGDTEFSHAKIYRLITEKLSGRYEMYQRNQQGEVMSIGDADSVPTQEYSLVLSYMEYLAFLGMMAQEINLNSVQLTEAYNKIVPEDKRQEKGFKAKFFKELKGLGIVKRNSEGTQAEFIHLTFQEYFAARYVAKSIKAFCEDRTEGLTHPALLEFVRTKKWDSFYSVMWWFVAGILGETSTAANYERYLFQESHLLQETLPIPESHKRLQVLQTFFDLLLQEPRAELGFEEVMLLAKSLEEAKMPRIMQKEAIVKHMRVWWEFYSKGSYDLTYTRLALLERTLISSPTVLRETQIVAALMKALSDDNWRVRRSAAFSLGQLNQETPEIIDTLINKLDLNMPADVLNTITEMLIGLNVKTPEFYIVLINILKNEKFIGIINPSILIYVTNALVQFQTMTTELTLIFFELFSRLPLQNFLDTIPIYFRRYENIDSKIILILMEKLLNKNMYVRMLAAKSLGESKVRSREVIYALTQILASDEISNVRSYAAEALGQLKEKTTEVASSLIKALSDKDLFVRSNAAAALGQLNQRIPEALTVLIKALSDEDKDVRSNAASALGQLNQGTPEVLNALIKALSDEGIYVRNNAASALGQLNQGTPEVVSALLKALSDKYSAVRIKAASSLGQLNHVTSEAVSALIQTLSDGNSYTRSNAASILGELNQGTPAVVSALILALSDEDRWVRIETVSSLIQFNQRIPEVLAALIDGLSDRNHYIRSDTASALGQLNQGTAEVLAALIKALSDKYEDVRRNVVSALVQLKQTKKLFDAIFPNQPLRLPPSQLINDSADVPQVDSQGNLQVLKLCGNGLKPIIDIAPKPFLLFENSWTLAIVRKKEIRGAQTFKSDLRFFKSPLNNLTAHAFLIIEGIKNGVRFAKKIDFYALSSGSSQSSRQRVGIEVTDLTDFQRFSELAPRCCCMIQSVSREVITTKLIPNIKRDIAAAEQGEIKYNLSGHTFSSSFNNTHREYSCISWCLEKWQELELPLQRRWTDLLVVLPTQHLPEDSKNSNCLIM